MNPLLMLLWSTSTLAVQDGKEVEPGKAPEGRICRWQSADGLPYEYRVPENWSSRAVRNLTVVFHGNGGDERWTFLNHPEREFRPDDVVVSPDGTTYVESMKNDEFLGERKDAERVHALLGELRAAFQPERTFLYGHSQGSFFVLFYAGEYPDDVDGVLAHASGMWNWTKQGKKGQHQSIALMHGTDDHIPYGQSVWARDSYEEQGYPHVHLRTLFDWTHRPHYLQAGLGLAWCEGMASDRPERVAVSLHTLADPAVPLGPDLVALREVAVRASSLEGLAAKDRSLADSAVAAIDAFAETIVRDVESELGKKRRLDTILEDGRAVPALGLVVRATEELRGVPAWEAFTKQHAKELEAADKAASRAAEKFWAKVEDEPAAAVASVIELLEKGAMYRDTLRILNRMESVDLDAKEVRLPKKAASRLEELSRAFRQSREKGFEDFVRRAAKLEF